MASLRIAQLRENWTQNDSRLEVLIEKGVFQSLSLHHGLLLLAPSICALLISRRSSPYVRYLRWIAFLWTTALGIWMMRNCRTTGGGNGYFIGALIVPIIFRCGTMLVIRDPETQFKRLERIPHGANKGIITPTTHRQDVMVWQAYPESVTHRLSWVLGLMISPRGSCWNWRIRASGNIPAPLLQQLEKRPTEPVAIQSESTVTRRWAEAVVEVLKYRLYILPLEFLMHRDPYFWGDIHADWRMIILSRSWSFPASSFPAIAYRALVGIWAARLLGSLAHRLLVATLLTSFVLFPNFARLIFRVPVNEAWMIPSAYGPHEAIWRDGLRGWWGEFWHQFLRYDFLAWSEALRAHLPPHSRKALAARYLTFIVVALMTTALHVCGSYTQFAEGSSPTSVACTFLVHALGLVLQTIWATVIFPQLPMGGVPVSVRRTANFLTTWLWAMMTGRYMFDDQAVGGVYVSFLRTLSW